MNLVGAPMGEAGKKKVLERISLKRGGPARGERQQPLYNGPTGEDIYRKREENAAAKEEEKGRKQVLLVRGRGRKLGQEALNAFQGGGHGS